MMTVWKAAGRVEATAWKEAGCVAADARYGCLHAVDDAGVPGVLAKDFHGQDAWLLRLELASLGDKVVSGQGKSEEEVLKALEEAGPGAVLVRETQDSGRHVFCAATLPFGDVVYEVVEAPFSSDAGAHELPYPLARVAPESVWKIATLTEAEAWKSSGELAGSPLDLQDGFFHAANATRVRDIAAMFYKGQNIVLLRLELPAPPAAIWVPGETATDDQLLAAAKKLPVGGPLLVRAIADGCQHVFSHTVLPFGLVQESLVVKFDEEKQLHAFNG